MGRGLAKNGAAGAILRHNNRTNLFGENPYFGRIIVLITLTTNISNFLQRPAKNAHSNVHSIVTSYGFEN